MKGIRCRGPFDHLTEEEWQRLLRQCREAGGRARDYQEKMALKVLTDNEKEKK
jgi:hypothetical protein